MVFNMLDTTIPLNQNRKGDNQAREYNLVTIRGTAPCKKVLGIPKFPF